MKLFKGDLLILTSIGFKRADEITKDDLILSLNSDGSFKYEEIEEINKIFKKKYTLNKIENYYLNDNIQIYSLKNLPLSLDLKETKEHLDIYKNNCIGLTKIGDISTFDFIGFPIKNNDEIIDRNPNMELVEMGLKITNPDLKLFSLYDLFNLTKEELKDIHLGFMEREEEIEIDATNKKLYHFIKYICLLLGKSLYSHYKEGKLEMKISKKTNENINYNFIYENVFWNKLKAIKKKPNYTGNLYHLKLKSGNPYLSDIGFIS